MLKKKERKITHMFKKASATSLGGNGWQETQGLRRKSELSSMDQSLFLIP